MSTVLVTGIGELVTHDASRGPGLGIVTDAALVLTDGAVSWTGAARSAPAADEVVDVGGRAVVPGFVDSHAHLVFAGDRAEEFAARMAGTPYDGGGIATTVAATRAASDEQLAARGVVGHQRTDAGEQQRHHSVTAAIEAASSVGTSRFI